MVAEEIYLNRPNNFFKNIINSFDEKHESIIPIVKNNNHNIWKKNNKGLMEPLFKTSLPSGFVDYKIYEEVKGLGSLVKAETFEYGGRESSFQKFIEVDRKNVLTTKDITEIDLA